MLSSLWSAASFAFPGASGSEPLRQFSRVGHESRQFFEWLALGITGRMWLSPLLSYSSSSESRPLATNWRRLGVLTGHIDRFSIAHGTVAYRIQGVRLLGASELQQSLDI